MKAGLHMRMNALMAVLAACLLLSCTRTADSPRPRAPEAPALFETAFLEGATATEAGRTLVFALKRIGGLTVTSGRIVACDPIVLFETEPFSSEFPTGTFPVELAVARMGNDERVALARILFSERPVVRWEQALTKEQDPAKLKADEYYGYGVDSGTGGFMDEKTAKALQARIEQDQAFLDRLIAGMDKTYIDTWSWGLVDIDGENAAMFSSGYGDGSYASYIGYDAQGRIVRLLTDFEVVTWRVR